VRALSKAVGLQDWRFGRGPSVNVGLGEEESVQTPSIASHWSKVSRSEPSWTPHLRSGVLAMTGPNQRSPMDLSEVGKIAAFCGVSCGLFGQIPQDSLGIPRDRGILGGAGESVPCRIPVVTRRGGGTCESGGSRLRLSDLTTREVQPGGMRKSRAARV